MLRNNNRTRHMDNSIHISTFSRILTQDRKTLQGPENNKAEQGCAKKCFRQENSIGAQQALERSGRCESTIQYISFFKSCMTWAVSAPFQLSDVASTINSLTREVLLL
ncbi:hypothetical protein M378DRAFT_640368 [Amanita muscaria Koide BX008]|uniref:Uncharacterized protein n=1 Tax=Amanita muscaria (strain Koide BX008) TaxID=946122 RepID=A0A0C2RY69_AMAMK|nr:hypothetical protein M378DRAFT_740828 [Amanita muscaria Koide BX008]KIL55275.1 hypothetical protein M378DRAFT_640368 [Amanita muscaria Koide BX008]